MKKENLFKLFIGIAIVIACTFIATFIHNHYCINDTVNFDRYFETVYVDNETAVEEVQGYIDDGYIVKWGKLYHHHATEDMLNCVFNCDEATTVVIDGNEYIVEDFVYIEDITDINVKNWLYLGNEKIITCTEDELEYSRWVVVLADK